MNVFDLQPTEENIVSTLEKNLLNRNSELMYFVSLLNSVDGPYSIAVDAHWGAGKTFFVKQAKLVLDASNDHQAGLVSDLKERVKYVWAQITMQDKPMLEPQVSVYYDAWANDCDEDPILSLIFSILQSVSSDYSFVEKPGFIDTAASIMETLTGRSIHTTISALRGNDPFAELRKTKGVQNQISEFLASLLYERGNRLVIFIDELDRCTPTFAVKLLERIKHYFSNDLITFVFSINKEQLQHAVRKHYGNDFNAAKYLDRFFDITVDLPPANLEKFYQNIGLSNTSYIFEKVCKMVIEKNHFTPREITKFYGSAKIAAYKPTHGNGYDFSFPDGQARRFCLQYVLPIMMGLKISEYEKYNDFISGKDSSPLHKIFNDINNSVGIGERLLSRNETYDSPADSYQTKVIFCDKIEEVYNALFVRDYTAREYEKRIGELSFDAETRTWLLKAVSSLSGYADYEN